MATTPYVRHFVFRPLQTINVPGAKVTAFEATGITDNMEGRKMLARMSARCEAISADLTELTRGGRSHFGNSIMAGRR